MVFLGKKLEKDLIWIYSTLPFYHIIRVSVSKALLYQSSQSGYILPFSDSFSESASWFFWEKMEEDLTSDKFYVTFLRCLLGGCVD